MKRRIALTGLLCLFLSGCSVVREQKMPEVASQTGTVFAMDTVMELTVYSEDETILAEVTERITGLEEKLSVTIAGSEIHTLNTVGESVLSEDTKELLSEALGLCKSTVGALDISIYPAVKAWGFTTGEYRIPGEEELCSVLEKIDYKAVELTGNTARLSEGMQVDLGSVAKGYTGDVLYVLLKERGVSSALMNLGGNVHALGSKPDGSCWRVAVQHPTKDVYLGVLELSDAAAVTSGGYERYFTGEDGKTYWHIIDPATGAPADSGLSSVTIVGKRGLVCDALSTALFVMGLEKATEYWKSEVQEFEAIFVTVDEKVYITEGLQECFTLAEAYAENDFTVIMK